MIEAIQSLRDSLGVRLPAISEPFIMFKVRQLFGDGYVDELIQRNTLFF